MDSTINLGNIRDDTWTVSAYGRASRVSQRLARVAAALGFTLLTLVPLALLAFGGLTLAGRAVRSDVETRVSASATGAAAFTEQQLIQLTAAADNAARRHLLVSAVGTGDPTKVDLPTVDDQLRQLRTLDTGISGAWLTDLDGRLLTAQPVDPAAQALIGKDFSYRDWFTGLRTRDVPYVSPAFQNRRDGGRVVSVSTWVRDDSGRRVGVLGLSYDFSQLRSYAEMARAQGVRLIVTDERGTVVSDPRVAGNELVSRAEDVRVRSALAGRTGIVDADDGTLSAYAPVSRLGWSVTAEVEKSQAFAGMTQLRRVVFGTAGLLGLALLFGTVLLVRLGKRQRHSAEELLHSQQRFRSAFDDALVGMAIVDRRNGRMVTANSTLAAMLDRPVQTLVGSNWSDFALVDDLEPGREDVSFDADGTVLSFRTRKRHPALPVGQEPAKPGRPGADDVILDISGALMRSGKGAHQQYVVQVLDISAAQRAAEELAARTRELTEANIRLEEQALDLATARDLAEEASRLKSAFVANMSHEIRTPMNGVLGMTQLLSDAALPPVQQEQATLAHRSAQALLTVLDDVLDFSKIEAGQLDLEMVDVDLRGLVDDAVRLFRGPAEDKGLQLISHVDPRVPAWVSSDPSRLRQVLLNLIGNAVKFTESGSVRVEVTREATIGRAAAIRLAVVDTGIGIDPAKQPSLFEPFRQAEESTTRRYGGTGLGLAISSSLVTLLGGMLDLISRPGTGSTFSFTLVLSSPVHAQDIPAARRETSTGSPAIGAVSATSGAPGAGDGSSTGPLLLLAEDNPVNQKVAQGQLSALGYRVDVVDDGVEAVEAARTGCYAAILMDCQMPRMDGYQATREIRRAEGSERRIPIIAVTASALTVDRERCLAAGMDDHLAKPVPVAQLADTLQRWAPHERRPDPAADVDDDERSDLLDRAILDDLVTLPADALAAVLDSYVAATEERLAALRASILDAESTTLLAHAVKGSSASLAARNVAEVAAALEHLGRTALEGSGPFDAAEADDLLRRLDHEFARVRPALQDALLGGEQDRRGQVGAAG